MAGVGAQAQQFQTAMAGAACLQFWRQEPGALEHPVDHAQVLRLRRILAQVQRLACAREVIELPARQCLADALLRLRVEQHGSGAGDAGAHSAAAQGLDAFIQRRMG